MSTLPLGSRPSTKSTIMTFFCIISTISSGTTSTHTYAICTKLQIVAFHHYKRVDKVRAHHVCQTQYTSILYMRNFYWKPSKPYITYMRFHIRIYKALQYFQPAYSRERIMVEIVLDEIWPRKFCSGVRIPPLWGRAGWQEECVIPRGKAPALMVIALSFSLAR